MNMVKPESIASEGGSVEVNASQATIEIMGGLNCFIVDVKSGALTSWKMMERKFYMLLWNLISGNRRTVIR